MVVTPFKVTDFGTNGKWIYDFPLVINTNLHPISHHFQVIADYWSNVHFWRGVPVFNTLVFGELLNSGPWDLALKNLETLLYRVVLVYWQTVIWFCHNSRTRLTDRQTDRGTERRQQQLALIKLDAH